MLSALQFIQRQRSSLMTKTRNAAYLFGDAVKRQQAWQLYTEPDLDIVAYFKTPENKTITGLNRMNKEIFDTGMKSSEDGFHVSLFKIPADQFTSRFPGYQSDAPEAVILRSVFMKEEHEEFIDEFTRRLFRY